VNGTAARSHFQQVRPAHTRHHTPRHSQHTYPHSCSTRRCHARRRRCTLQRVVNFLLRRLIPHFITLYRRPSCSHTDIDHIVVISINHSIYACNNIVATALLVVLQCRLGKFLDKFSLIPRLTLLTSRRIAFVRGRSQRCEQPFLGGSFALPSLVRSRATIHESSIAYAHSRLFMLGVFGVTHPCIPSTSSIIHLR
jgi:hypothetical protein